MKERRLNIAEVVEQRLKLQTVQKNISNKFDILFPSIDKIKQSAFLQKFSSWDADRQKSFLIELGGQINIGRTKDWLLNLSKTSK